MKLSLKKVVRHLVNTKLGRNVVRRAYWMLDAAGTAQTGQPQKICAAQASPDGCRPPMGKFIDSEGVSHERIQGYRDMIVPRWRGMFEPKPDSPTVDASSIVSARKAVFALQRLIGIHGECLAGWKVLEIGCHGGAHALALAEAGASHVDAIDIPEYGVRQRVDASGSTDEIEQQSTWLDRLRASTWQQFQHTTGCSSIVRDRVSFADLDVAELDVTNEYDLIVSWQTLEHITDPVRAFRKMARALKPGGFLFTNTTHSSASTVGIACVPWTSLMVTSVLTMQTVHVTCGVAAQKKPTLPSGSIVRV